MAESAAYNMEHNINNLMTSNAESYQDATSTKPLVL